MEREYVAGKEKKMKLSSLNEETFRLKFRNLIYLPLTKNMRRKTLKNDNFTIISNNCWGGTVYESYGIRKMSPTVGMFIMPEDYLKFVANLDYYLKRPLEFIDPDDSKWKETLQGKSNWKTYLIARLDDIELQMLHHHDEAVARRKWEDRIKRVNRDRLIFKFNDQNGATKEQIRRFMKLPLEHKLCFVATPDYKVNGNVVFVKQPRKYSGGGIKASREPFGKSRYIDLTAFINSVGEKNEE